MICPICKKSLETTIFYGISVDYCPKCLGIFFEEDELRLAKDKKDKDLNWLDIDLWKKDTSFKISPGQKLCPACRLPLYEVNYGNSEIHLVKSAKGGAAKPQFNGVKVDLCNLCRGIWLDRGEFKKIIEYLKNEGYYQCLNMYARCLIREFWEIFSGPESLREEISDFLTISKLLNYKFSTQHSAMTKMISNLPR